MESSESIMQSSKNRQNLKTNIFVIRMSLAHGQLMLVMGIKIQSFLIFA
jgi:hypothetical protein